MQMKQPVVVFVANLALAHCRRILRGVAGAAPTRRWRLVVLAPRSDLGAMLRALRPDGIVIHLSSRADARAVTGLDVPVVNVSGLLDLSLPRVGVDDVAVGRLAARHLLGLGLEHAVAVVDEGHAAARRREQGFRAELAAAGRSARALHIPRHDGAPHAGSMLLDRRAVRWLGALPRPVGVFAYHDALALQLCEAMRLLGRAVPDDAAVLGVDDDDLVCALGRPTLSSIALPSERVGSRAAELMERLLAGERAPREPLLLPPTGVVARQSTDLVASADPAVAAFLAHLRDGGAAATVTAAVRTAGVSRRTLERRLRAAIGRGPAEELRRRRLERAQRLLITTGLPMEQIAQRAGFPDAKRMALVFRRLAKTTASAWRRANR